MHAHELATVRWDDTVLNRLADWQGGRGARVALAAVGFVRCELQLVSHSRQVRQ